MELPVSASSGILPKEIAVAAVRALGHEFGGVDILEHPSGRLNVLESNNPCYFASAQLAIGTDVSGAMVEHLLQKAGGLEAGADTDRRVARLLKTSIHSEHELRGKADAADQCDKATPDVIRSSLMRYVLSRSGACALRGARIVEYFPG
jgi:hypothetical protein